MGKRGGNLRPSRFTLSAPHERDMRPSALRKGLPLKPGTPTDSVILMRESFAPYLECAEIEETVATHIVPRVSLTERHHLGWFADKKEFTDEQRIQTDTRTGNPVLTTEPRLTWKADKTLLRRGIPDQLKDKPFFRVTSRSKRKIYEPELPPQLEIAVEPTLDDLELIGSPPTE